MSDTVKSAIDVVVHCAEELVPDNLGTPECNLKNELIHCLRMINNELEYQQERIETLEKKQKK